jgi:PKD repeat protein
MKVNKTATILALIVLSSGSLFAQNTFKIKGKATKVATVNILEQSKTTIDKEKAPVFKAPNKEWKNPEWEVGDKVIYLDNKKAVINTPSRSRTSSPAPETTFLGILDSQNSIPPDVMGVAGPDHVMTTLNTKVRIHDKAGNTIMTTTLSSFWTSMPNSGDTFDPKIVYDPYNNRWIFVTPSHPSGSLSKIFIGVSQTSDPTGDWNMYYINTDPTNITWFDFPTIGFNKKWIVVSGNQFGNDYYRTIFVINKQEAYDGVENLTYTRFATTEGFTIAPAVTYDTVLEQIYLISSASGNSNGYGYIKKFKIDGPVDNPAFEYEGSIGVPDTWDTWAGYYGNFLPQKGSSALINSVDSRIGNVIYRNGKLWAVHHIFVPANNPQRAAVQWWELDTTGTVLQRGRIEDTTNLYSFAFPTIAVNKFEDILIGHDIFSTQQYASAGYSFRGNYEEPGTIRTYYQYKDGLDTYNKTFGHERNRWGDYSGTCLDPVDQTDFWTVQEYAETPANTWSTYWAYIKTTYPPIAEFESKNTLIPTGESIDFKDLSLGIPSQWEWNFEGGNPSTSADQNPAQIKFEEDGTYNIQMIASNELGTDTILKESYITASSTILPEIHFSADCRSVCTGSAVYFIDSTLYMPRSWEWQFTPATVTFLEGTDEYSQNPVVAFNEPGNYSVTLSATNLNGLSTETVFDFISSGGYVPYFHENFDNGFGEQFWEVDSPENEPVWAINESTGWYSNTSAVIDFTEYTTYGKRARLITPPFNLEGMSNAVLEFKHAYATRYDGATDSLIVLISDDCGATWTRLTGYGEDGSGNFATHKLYNGEDLWVPNPDLDWCGQSYGSGCNSINLNGWVGKSNVRIAFESVNSFGNPLYIDNVTISQFVGVKESTNYNSVVVYPNPASDHLTIDFGLNSSYDRLVISNQLGQKVFSKNINEANSVIKLNTAEWPKGVYFVRLESNSKSTAKKVVIY